MEKHPATIPGISEGAMVFSFFTEIGIISQLSSTLFESVLPQGLSLAQFGVLNWFSRVDSVATPGRLAKAFQVTGGAMTNTLKKLEHRQLILIEPDPESGRKKRVTMTKKGEQMRELAIDASAPLLSELTDKFDKNFILNQIKELAEVRRYLDERRFSKERGKK
jgi:DNA-binding MarR family transcriptional regulator